MGSFYNGLDEFRLSRITMTQGHYMLFKNIGNAFLGAKKHVNKDVEPWLVQKWKPKRGERVYILLPKSLKHMSKRTLVSFYKDQGYDVSYIMSKKYIIKRL